MTTMLALHDKLTAVGIPNDYDMLNNEVIIRLGSVGDVWVSARPTYCNRGRFLVHVESRDIIRLDVDEADRFPRYYFGVDACADEIKAWLVARKVLPAAVACR